MGYEKMAYLCLAKPDPHIKKAEDGYGAAFTCFPFPLLLFAHFLLVRASGALGDEGAGGGQVVVLS